MDVISRNLADVHSHYSGMARINSKCSFPSEASSSKVVLLAIIKSPVLALEWPIPGR